MSKKNRTRKRIFLAINSSLLQKLNSLSESLQIPKGRILEDTVLYILNKEKSPKKNITLDSSVRESLNTTINTELWSKFRYYCNSNDCTSIQLIEEYLPNIIKKYQYILKKYEKK